MLIRREEPRDVQAIAAVTASAFRAAAGGDGEPVEVGLLTELRGSGAWLPALSLVAIDGDEVVGHVVCTRASLAGTPALGLGPLGVRPDRRRRGTGAALMHAVLGAADALDEPVVVLLGDPAYYGRFGFRPAAELRIEPPVSEWAPHFMARPLHAWDPAMGGAFAYAEPFMRV